MGRKRSNSSTAPANRRGTIIILAVGILAILSIATVGYVTVVRLERRSAADYAREIGSRSQINAVVGRARALLAADLFGNKIVTPGVRREVTDGNNVTRVWPAMFEDGEYWDYPRVDPNWLRSPLAPGAEQENNIRDNSGLQDRNAVLVNNAIDYARVGVAGRLSSYRAAPPDDAWLASQEPVDTDDDGVWDTWPQLTNLRSAYRWFDGDGSDTGESDGTDGFWFREDGRYVDLGEWLVKSRADAVGDSLDDRGDPGLDIGLFDNSAFGGLGSGVNGGLAQDITATGGPNLGVANNGGFSETLVFPANPAEVGSDLRIFEAQMSRLQDLLHLDLTGLPNAADDVTDQRYMTVEPGDWRLFADADGDSRPDSRWQQLDEIGDSGGLRWVVAARIIDNSAMINVNTATELYHPDAALDATRVGFGLTPVDIDLYRLLRGTIDNGGPADFARFHPDVDVNAGVTENFLEDVYEYHRYGVGAIDNMAGLLNDIIDNSDRDLFVSQKLVSNRFLGNDVPEEGGLSRRVREAYWRYAAMGAPDLRLEGSIVRFSPVGDEEDLRGFWGYNNDSAVSLTEERLGTYRDNSNALLGFIPGAQTPGGGSPQAYPQQQSLGPMRAGEPTFGETQPRTFDVEDVGRPEFPTGGTDYNHRGKILRQQRDIRRHLTSVSGSSNSSPLPPLGVNSRSERIEKVVINEEPVNELEFASGAFDAFMWALAPLATDAPIAYPLVSADMAPLNNAIGDMSDGSRDLHYGGSSASAPSGTEPPQIGQAQRLGDMTESTLDGVDRMGLMPYGADYAALKSVALTANLIDAIDEDLVPTVVSFALNADRDVDSSNATQSIILGANRAHGTIPVESLFEDTGNQTVQGLAGNISGGVTAVGFERQPFLVEAAVTTFLCDSNLETGGPPPDARESLIEIMDPLDKVGTAIAVELYNPWPDDITNTAAYSIVLGPQGEGNVSVTLDLGAADGADITIPSGQSRVFAWAIDLDAVPAMTYPGNAYLDTTYKEMVQAWRDELDANVGGALIMLEDAAITISTQPTAIQDSSTIENRAFFLTDITEANSQLPVILQRGVSGGTAVVDRLSSNSDEWPVASAARGNMTYGVNGTPFFRFGMVRVAMTSVVRRPTYTSTGPAYVVERADENQTESIDPTDIDEDQTQTILYNEMGATLELDGTATQLGITSLQNNIRFLDNGRTPTNVTLPDVRLFSPNEPMRSLTDLHLVNAVASIYFPISLPSADANPLGGALGRAHLGPGFQAGRWITFSEWLGTTSELERGAMTVNPYAGVLDPTRYVPGGDLDDITLVNSGAVTDERALPPGMQVPLATRVFDCFDALPRARALAPGVVNINTAPVEVLESLPLGYVEDPILPGSGFIPDNANAREDSRAWLARDYRDMASQIYRFTGYPDGGVFRRDPSTSTVTRENFTDILGLRENVSNELDASMPETYQPGFVSVGELAVLGEWNQATGQLNTGTVSAGGRNYRTFTEIGADGSPSEDAPLVIWGNNAASSFMYPLATDGHNLVELVDDPEERLALARGWMQTASTRSDIFTVYFVVRAYEPGQIEAIPADINAINNPVDRATMLNEEMDVAGTGIESPGLRPVVEQRWLCVLDRSEVRLPTDRPEVLLLVELPMD